MLSDLHTQWLEERAISVEAAERFGIYSANRSGKEVAADANGTILVFPFREGGSVVNEKYRGPKKSFWQWPNEKKKTTFFNVDALANCGNEPLVITEGELDCVVAADAGFHAVSVPDGAPPATENQAQPRMEYLVNNQAALKRVKRFILATDADGPGQRLAQELCRTLSPSRCLSVSYPAGCKDLNDVAKAYGREGVERVLKQATPYPIHGLYKLSDYPEGFVIDPVSTGWHTLDRHFLPYAGGLTVITGVPSHGKSAFALNLLVNLAQLHGWRSAIFSPEMPVVPFLRKQLINICGGSRAQAVAFLDDMLCFMDADHSGATDEPFTLDWVLDKATEAVLRHGIKCLLIDPWNEMEHCRNRDETMTDYIGRALRAIKRWARDRQVAVIIVAHPTKNVVVDGAIRGVNLYDIEGSAHWFNKCDHGIVVRRNHEMETTTIDVAKVRFRDTGERGEIVMKFRKDIDTFTTLDGDLPQAVVVDGVTCRMADVSEFA